jgi:hypothetical protein
VGSEEKRVPDQEELTGQRMAKPKKGGGARAALDPHAHEVESFLAVQKALAATDTPTEIWALDGDGNKVSFRITSRPAGWVTTILNKFHSIGFAFDRVLLNDKAVSIGGEEAVVHLREGRVEEAHDLAAKIRAESQAILAGFTEERQNIYVEILQMLVLPPTGRPPDVSECKLTKEMVLNGLTAEQASVAIVAFYTRDVLRWRVIEKKILLHGM